MTLKDHVKPKPHTDKVHLQEIPEKQKPIETKTAQRLPGLGLVAEACLPRYTKKLYEEIKPAYTMTIVTQTACLY